MRLLFIIIDQSIEPDVLEALEQQGVEHWSRWDNVHGAGRTGTKRGDPIWPGLNVVFLVAVTQEVVEPLVESLHAMRDKFPLIPGLRILSVPVEQM